VFNLCFYERAYKLSWARLVRGHFDGLTSFTSLLPISTQRYMRGNSNRSSWKVVLKLISCKWESKWFYILQQNSPLPNFTNISLVFELFRGIRTDRWADWTKLVGSPQGSEHAQNRKECIWKTEKIVFSFISSHACVYLIAWIIQCTENAIPFPFNDLYS
jgi:hypothetical protein